MKLPGLAGICTLSAVLSHSVFAADVSGGGTILSFSTSHPGFVMLKMSGPNTYVESSSLDVYLESPLPDGSYSYEVIAQSIPELGATKSSLDNGRDYSATNDSVASSVVESGFFRVVGGYVQSSHDIEEEPGSH